MHWRYCSLVLSHHHVSGQFWENIWWFILVYFLVLITFFVCRWNGVHGLRYIVPSSVLPTQDHLKIRNKCWAVLCKCKFESRESVCDKEVCRAWVSYHIPQNTVGFNYLSMFLTPVCWIQVVIINIDLCTGNKKVGTTGLDKQSHPTGYHRMWLSIHGPDTCLLYSSSHFKCHCYGS